MKLLTMDNIHWHLARIHNTGRCSHESHGEGKRPRTFATLLPIAYTDVTDAVVTVYLPCGHVVVPTPYDGLAPDVLTRLLLSL